MAAISPTLLNDLKLAPNFVGPLCLFVRNILRKLLIITHLRLVVQFVRDAARL